MSAFPDKEGGTKREGYHRGPPVVPKAWFVPVITELVRRIGAAESARRIGLKKAESISKRVLDRQETVRQSTYEKAVAALEEARRRGEDGWDREAVVADALRQASRLGWETSSRKRIEESYESRRNNIEHVRGFPNMPIRVKKPFTWRECQSRWYKGKGVPMDLLPPEFWRAPGAEFPRFSEETLGDDF